MYKKIINYSSDKDELLNNEENEAFEDFKKSILNLIMLNDGPTFLVNFLNKKLCINNLIDNLFEIWFHLYFS